MIPEVKALEPKLKQILYGCVEHVQATKAALYLSTSHDLNQRTFEVVTSYRFDDNGRRVLRSNDDLVDQLAVKRAGFFVNGVGTDMRFSEMLFRQGTDRLLATPLFARGRLVGFIDMRDKAGKRPFEIPDVDAAKKIADELTSLLSAKQLFGLAPIKVVGQDTPHAATRVEGSALPPSALRVIAAAKETISKRQLANISGKHALTERDLEVTRLLLPAALAIPGAVLACFSAMGHVNNPQSIVAIATVTEDAMEMLQSHLQAWLARANQPQMTTRPQLIYPFGVQVVPVTADGISTILSAPVNAQSVEGLVLTIGFERIPEAQAQRAMHIFLGQMERSIEAAIAASAGRNDRQTLAEYLLEPDFQTYPELVEHSRQVATIAQRFAITLDLPTAQVESVRIAALLHDVGLRLLDYERLYRRPNLTREEMRALAEHPVVGAALVEPLLGSDIAQAILRHHERIDGKGYPSRLSGAQIPLASRIIQIADAWVAMTAASTYQPSITHEQAVARLREGAGTQFDEQLVTKFVGALTQIGA
jgi:hypothetical protein